MSPSQRPSTAAILVALSFTMPALAAGDSSPSPAAAADPDYSAGLAAAQQGDWKQTITRMSAVVKRQPGNADAWNELGHAYRKTKDMDHSFEAYEHALRIDPKHRNAREYLGEAYLQVNQPAKAEEQLQLLGKLCRQKCEQYDDLREALADYKKAHP